MIPADARWREREICVLDVETTGLDPFDDRVVEVAAFVVSPKGERVRSFSTLVNPGRPIPAASTEAHGIVDADVATAPRFADIAVELVTVVGDAIPAAYNARFDHACIGAEYVRAGLGLPWWLKREVEWVEPMPWIDPLIWARAAQPRARGKGRFKLGIVAERLGVRTSTAHRAMGDCETTMRVLWRLGRASENDQRFRELPPETYGDLVKRQRILSAGFELDFLEWLSRQPPLNAPEIDTEFSTTEMLDEMEVPH